MESLSAALGHPLTLAFLAALALTTGLRVWLAARHTRFIAAHRAAVPAEFAGSITLDSHQKAADYTTAKTRLGIIETFAGAALLLALTLGGGLQLASEQWARWFAPGGYAHGLALLGTLAFVSGLVDLPFALVRTFRIEARFGFNRMTVKLFLADLAKSTAIGIALGAPLALLVLWLMARMGALWWLWVWLAWLAFNLLVLALYPTLIAPIFNKFNPLADEGLQRRIETLLARCGFRSRGVFVMDGSRRSSHGNAYFTGFGASKRIVFFDTLVNRLAPQEIEAVLAHELGHFKRRHIVKRLAWVFGASLVFLALLGYLIDKPWFYGALGVTTPSTAMALALFFMVVPVFTFPLAPVSSFCFVISSSVLRASVKRPSRINNSARLCRARRLLGSRLMACWAWLSAFSNNPSLPMLTASEFSAL